MSEQARVQWKERAQRIVDENTDQPAKLNADLVNAIVAVLEEERERCAKALDHWEGTGNWLRKLEDHLEWDEGLRKALIRSVR